MSSDEDGGAIGRSSKTRPPAYIINGVDRRKYFAERIKAIRSRVETFARCTGENILVIAVDEDGRAHHWGTSAFQKFVADERVTGIMYQYLKEPQNATVRTTPRLPKITDPTQLAHLQALVQEKVDQAGGSVHLGKMPSRWPPRVPFRPPSELDGDQLIAVARSFIERDVSNEPHVLLAQHVTQMAQVTKSDIEQPHESWVPELPDDLEDSNKRPLDPSGENAQGPLKLSLIHI
eukprot:TRINITY_DN9636_c0_g1_i2.p1 TRINITY_DN9636_c0_g1~~TRINITY_DN9636_c0_g1_i2.p1  ORF type:complete len:234 (+),score=34.62 TRINITY_DN9636_c0_g1_i2:153-854(+)